MWTPVLNRAPVSGSWRDVLGKAQPGDTLASARSSPPAAGAEGATGAAAATPQGADSSLASVASLASSISSSSSSSAQSAPLPPPPPPLDDATALRLSRGLPAVALGDAADVRGAGEARVTAPRNGTAGAEGSAGKHMKMFDISTTMGVVMAFIMLTIGLMIAGTVLARFWRRRKRLLLLSQTSAEVGLLAADPASRSLQSDATALAAAMDAAAVVVVVPAATPAGATDVAVAATSSAAGLAAPAAPADALGGEPVPMVPAGPGAAGPGAAASQGAAAAAVSHDVHQQQQQQHEQQQRLQVVVVLVTPLPGAADRC